MKSGKFPLDLAWLISIRFYRPRAHLFLINHGNSYVPSTDTVSRPTAAAAGVVLPPRENCLKRRASHCRADGGDIPHPIPFKQRNEAPSPLRSRGSKAGPLGVSTAAPGQKSQGRPRASPYRAETQARETLGTPKVVFETSWEVSEWDPTVGRHQATGA